MALETGTSINDLNILNPTSTDPKSAGDDHFRLVKAVAKHDLNGFTKGILMYVADTGSATAHVLTPTTALTAYGPGQILCYSPANANSSGAVTVNVSGLGAKSIKTNAGDDPTANSIAASKLLWLMYDGTNFVTMAGSAYLSKTGNQTFTGNLTLTGNQTVSGTFGVTGAVTMSSTLAVTGASTFTGDIGGTGGDKKADKAGSVYGAGTHDFSAGASVLVPTATLGGQAVNKTQLDAATFSAALPSQTGNAGKYVTTDGTNASWATVTPPQVVRSARTSNTILAASDNQDLIDITSGTFSQTFTAAATLGDGWYCYYRNSGTGRVTLDPDGAEQIDGLTSYIVYPGETRLIQCDGVGFNSVVLTPYCVTLTATEVWTKPPGYKKHGAYLKPGGGGGGSGSRRDTGTGRGGGGGGSGGPDAYSEFLDGLLGATETVTIGAGGTGGAAQTANDNGGNIGSAGGNTTFGTHLLAKGGTAGNGGGAGTAAGGTAPTGFPNATSNSGGNGGTGQVSATGGTATALVGSLAATGGGGGAGASGGDTASYAGGPGGAHTAPTTTSGPNVSVASSAGGTTAGVAAVVGADGSNGRGATGGGGGAYRTGVVGMAGANGGSPGGGGGGGSGSDNGFNSGAGGTGGSGLAVIRGI